jgi:hypothetical protein
VVDGEARHLTTLGVDEINLSGESALDKGVEVYSSDPQLGQVGRDADDGDGTGMEDVLERVAARQGGVLRHGSFYWTLSFVRDGGVLNAGADWPLSPPKMIGWP